MARITVEDCLEHMDNRFQLVLVATKRARQIALGAEPMVPVDKDKPTVIALREIAEGLVSADILNEPVEPEISFDLLDDDSADSFDNTDSGSMDDDELIAALRQINSDPVTESVTAEEVATDSDSVQSSPDAAVANEQIETLESQTDGDTKPATGNPAES